MIPETTELPDTTAALEAELVEVRSQIDRVRDLHTRYEGGGSCEVCSNHGDVQWPCATLRALDSQEPV